MYEKVFEQAESMFKPMSEIMELNAQTFDALSTKHSALVNELLSDSVDFANGMNEGMRGGQLDLENYVEAQQKYWESLRDKLTASAQDSFDLVADAQDKVGKLMQGAVDAPAATVATTADLAEAQATSAAPSTKKKASAKKTAPGKKAAKKAAPAASSKA